MNKKRIIINNRKERRARRVRAAFVGTAARPRMSIFRSNRFTSVQLIDDVVGKTLVAVSSAALAGKKTKLEAAKALGVEVAKQAKAAGITAVVADRGSYRYHGRVRAVIESVREAGIAV